MKGARLLGAAAAAMAALTFSAPAAHAAPPTITLHTPAEKHTETNVRISGDARMPTSSGTVHGQLVMSLESRDGRPTQSHAINVNGNSVPFSWEVAAPYNGNYTVRVVARGRDGAVDASPNEEGFAVREITVEVLPAPPANVEVKTDAKRQATVTWDPNTEPDLLGYQVQRRLGDEQPDHPTGGWEPAGDTTVTELVDPATASAGGTYHYRVYAVRRGASEGTGIGSPPSETKSVSVANPPSTTSTTTGTGGPGGGNGGTGGGNGGNGGTGDGGSRGGTGGSGSPLAQTGKVDLSGFSALLQNARRTDPSTGRPVLDDGTFDETLPFKPGEEGEELGEDGTALGIGVEEAGADEGRPAIAFFAASLLVTVIVMHLLWLKREVDKAPDGALEPAEA